MSMEEDKSTWTRVQPAQVDAFVRRCILAAGGAVDQAHALAEVLTLADMRGHYSHGLNRLGEICFLLPWFSFAQIAKISR